MALKAEFTISARDKTKEAFDRVEGHFKRLEGAVNTLRYAIGGYLFAEFIRSVTETEIQLQSMQFTLRAATGSMAGARKEMNFLIDSADKLGVSVSSLGEYYSRMAVLAKTSGYTQKELHDLFLNVSGALRVLHLDATHTKYTWLALQEIMAASTVQTRHLTRQMMIDFPTGLQAAALGMHKTTGELLEMARAGKLMSHDFLMGLSKGAKELYGPEVQDASQGLQASLQRISVAWTEMIHNADQTGAFDKFGSTMEEIANELKDPAFQQAFASFITSLAMLGKWTVTGGAHVMHWLTEFGDGLGILAARLDGFKVDPSDRLGMAQQTLQNLKNQLKIAQADLNAQSSGMLKDSTKGVNAQVMRQINELKRQIDFYQTRVIPAIQKSLAATPPASNDPAQHVEALTGAQKQAFKAIADTDAQLQQQIQTFGKSKLQLVQYSLAAGQLHDSLQKLKGTSMYSAALKEYEIVEKDIKALERLAAAKKHAADVHRQQEADARELEHLKRSLQTREELVNSSYVKQYNDILRLTKTGSAEQNKLLGNLFSQYGDKAAKALENSRPQGFAEKMQAVEDEFKRERAMVLSNVRLTEDQRTALEERLTKDRNKRLAALESQKNQLLLSESSQLFGNLAQLADTFGGKSSAAYKALFLVSKAFSIAQSIIAIQTGIANAFELPYPANIAAAASVAAEGASIVATIKGVNYSGAYDTGGDIPAGKWGIAGEHGPEIVQGPAHVTSRADTAKMMRGGNVTYAPQITMDNRGMDAATLAKSTAALHRLRQQLHYDFKFFLKHGYFPQVA